MGHEQRQEEGARRLPRGRTRAHGRPVPGLRRGGQGHHRAAIEWCRGLHALRAIRGTARLWHVLEELPQGTARCGPGWTCGGGASLWGRGSHHWRLGRPAAGGGRSEANGDTVGIQPRHHRSHGLGVTEWRRLRGTEDGLGGDRGEDRSEVRKLVDEAYNTCKETLMANRRLLDEITKTLVEEETIGNDQLKDLVKEYRAAIPESALSAAAL